MSNSMNTDDKMAVNILPFKKPTDQDIQDETLKLSVSCMSPEDRQRVQEYMDKFVRMLNKGGQVAHLAFTIVGVEISKQ